MQHVTLDIFLILCYNINVKISKKSESLPIWNPPQNP